MSAASDLPGGPDPQIPRRPQLRLVTAEQLAAADAVWVDGLSPSMSLPQFSRVYVIDRYYAQTRASVRTIEILAKAMSLWQKFTADRALVEISELDTAAYITGLYTVPGREPDGKASPYTVDKYRRAVQLALDLAGPRTRDHREAKHLIDAPPYIPPQPLPQRKKHGFSLDELAAMMRAAEQMTLPREHDRTARGKLVPGTGMTPADWWRSLLAFAYNTAERRGALFGIEPPPADAQKVRFEAKIRKGGKKALEIPLNAAAREAIAKAVAVVRSDRTALFPWPHHMRYFYTQFHRLQTLAGIPPQRQHGLHGIRRATATEVSSYSPMAGQLILGHRDGTLLERAYVDDAIKQRALEQLPQPGQGIGDRERGTE